VKSPAAQAFLGSMAAPAHLAMRVGSAAGEVRGIADWAQAVSAAHAPNRVVIKTACDEVEADQRIVRVVLTSLMPNDQLLVHWFRLSAAR